MTTLLVVVFVLGYLAIAMEHSLHINKAAPAMLIGSVCWAIYALNAESMVRTELIPPEVVRMVAEEGQSADLAIHYLTEHQLLEHVGEIAGILFFLMGAMTIVEVVDAHEGFRPITELIRPKNKTQLLWVVCWVTFFLSAILDNLTTSIVMVSVLRKLVPNRPDRIIYAGMVVVAANAGGAWTVIGDVTTTMLWIKHRISAVDVMIELILPSIVCLLVPLVVMSFWFRGPIESTEMREQQREDEIQPWQQWLVLSVGTLGLLSVPVFKTLTHLPPFMGMLLALSVVWIASELIAHTIHPSRRSSIGILKILTRIDTSSVLFFLGILLAVSSLASIGLLENLAGWLDSVLPNRQTVALLIGIISAMVDNVPMVAAGIEMYDVPEGDDFWMLLAYCAGTGGSCSIIGSAAGVAVMGLQKIEFMWYLKTIAPLALLGYLSGAAAFYFQMLVFR